MKIKTKKQLNLPQLIEWAWMYDVRDKIFCSQEYESWVRVDSYGDVVDVYEIEPTDLFTVEEGIEITKKIELEHVVEAYKDQSGVTGFMEHIDKSIHNIQDEGGCKSLAFYILNDDLTMTLIWHDGELVE